VLAEAEAAKQAVLAKRAAAERARYHHRTESVSGGHDNDQKASLVVNPTTRIPGCQGGHQTPVPSGRDDFSGGRGDHLLNHKDKPQKIPAPTALLETELGTSPSGQTTSRARARGATSASTPEVEQAVKLYNDAARQHGFTQCYSTTEARRKRLRKRLDDIGGLDPFQRALSAIPRDRFLMGRKAPRLGEEPFKLTLDRLLQNDGGMGDVLARLIDLAAEGEAMPDRANASQAQLALEEQTARLREQYEAEQWR
jgi:hypothetical protein